MSTSATEPPTQRSGKRAVIAILVAAGIFLTVGILTRGRSDFQTQSSTDGLVEIAPIHRSTGVVPSTEAIATIRATFIRRSSIQLGLQQGSPEDDLWRKNREWVRFLGEPQLVTPALASVLRDVALDSRIRASALGAMAYYDEAETRRLVTLVLKRSTSDLKNDEILLAAISLAARFGLSEAWPDIETLLRDPHVSKRVKGELVKALPRIDKARAEQVLALLLADPQFSDFLALVSSALAEVGTYNAARSVLNRFLELPDPGLNLENSQKSITFLLHGLKKFPPELLKLLLTEHASMVSKHSLQDRNRLVTLLGHVGKVLEPEAIVTIGSALLQASPSPQLQAQSLHLIASANSKEAGSAILDALEATSEPSMVPVILSALASVNPSLVDSARLKGILVDLMGSPHAEVSTNAAELLGTNHTLLRDDPELVKSLETKAQLLLKAEEAVWRERGMGLLLLLTPSMIQGEHRLVELFPQLSKSSDSLMLAATAAMGALYSKDDRIKKLTMETISDPQINPSIRIQLATKAAAADYTALRPVLVAQLRSTTDLGVLTGWVRLLESYESDPVEVLQQIISGNISQEVKTHLTVELQALKLRKQ